MFGLYLLIALFVAGVIALLVASVADKEFATLDDGPRIPLRRRGGGSDGGAPAPVGGDASCGGDGGGACS